METSSTDAVVLELENTSSVPC